MTDYSTAPDRLELRVGWLIDGTGNPPRPDMSVVLSQGIIESVRPWDERTAVGAPIADLRGHTVVPGLIDGHTHLCWGSPASKGWQTVGGSDLGIVSWGLASAASALAAGITTVVDCGSPRGLARQVRGLIDNGVARGPSVRAAGEAITTTAGHGEFIGTTADSADELIQAVRRQVGHGSDLIKVMVTGGATDPHTNRRASQYGRDELAVVVADAHRLGRKVVGHANATSGIVDAVDAEVDIIAHCNWLGPEPGTVVVDFDAVDRMAERGLYVDLNLQGAVRPLAATDGKVIDWPGAELPRDRWQLLAPLRDRGVGVYLSSDAFGPAIGSFPGDLANAATSWGLAIEEVIHRVTALPARALALQDRGLVEPGYRADLAAYHGDLAQDTRRLAGPSAVYLAGQVAARNGFLLPPAASVDHSSAAAAQAQLIDEVLHAPS